MAVKSVYILGKHISQVAIVGSSVISLLVGCSSQLRTTTLTGEGPEDPKVHVTQLEPEELQFEEVIVQPVQEEPKIITNIPVEEPPSPAPRREIAPEVISTTTSTIAPSEGHSSPEVQMPVPADQPVSSMSVVTEPALERPMSGIPPISFEPEMPAFPKHEDSTLIPDIPMASVDAPEVPVVIPDTPMASVDIPESPIEEPQVVTPSKPEPMVEKEPIQLAKVMPQEPEQVEIMTETLEAALSDVYFDYDRFAIRDDAVQLLQANAALLSEQLAGANIIIEGHCDERGTQSYNMVLGEARANAVKTYLEDLGISGDQLEVVSYGKDKPFCREQTEECWQENRRGHFVIK